MSAPKRRRWPWFVGVSVGALAVAYGWFFISVPSAEGEWAVDLADVRRLANSLEGEKPTEVRVEQLAKFKFPKAVTRTGDGWRLQPMTVFSFQLVYPGQTVIIDTGATEGSLPGADVSLEATARFAKALTKAKLILVTHEHSDHLGGLTVQPNLKELLKVTKLNKEQISHPELLHPAIFPKGSLDGYQPMEYARTLAIAPGVVLIRAPGHTPGSQLVYVQRADGEEFLFLGDVAWLADNVESVRGRPRLGRLLMNEDTGAVLRQLEQLHALAVAEPRLHLVPGHDLPLVEALISQKQLVNQFVDAPAP